MAIEDIKHRVQVRHEAGKTDSASELHGVGRPGRAKSMGHPAGEDRTGAAADLVDGAPAHRQPAEVPKPLFGRPAAPQRPSVGPHQGGAAPTPLKRRLQQARAHASLQHSALEAALERADGHLQASAQVGHARAPVVAQQVAGLRRRLAEVAAELHKLDRHASIRSALADLARVADDIGARLPAAPGAEGVGPVLRQVSSMVEDVGVRLEASQKRMVEANLAGQPSAPLQARTFRLRAQLSALQQAESILGALAQAPSRR